jgi:predicted DNA binding CopG/RHH family protein
MKYDEYEKELIELEDKILNEVRDPTKKEKRALQEAARNTLIKDKRINIRISSRDLNSLQRRASRYGMPYQTLISSILHRYVSGDLREREFEPGGAGNVGQGRRA